MLNCHFFVVLSSLIVLHFPQLSVNFLPPYFYDCLCYDFDLILNCCFVVDFVWVLSVSDRGKEVVGYVELCEDLIAAHFTLSSL